MARNVKARATLDALDASSSPASKINLVIGIVVGLLVIATALVNYGKQSSLVDQVSQKVDAKANELSAKVDTASKDAQAKVDILSAKVDAANALTNAKQDALTKDFTQNQTEQQAFRANVQNLFDKVFSSQQALASQVQQERVDRLTDAVKKK